MRNIHANDLFKCLVPQKLTQKPTLAASEVENTLSSAASQRCDNGPHPLLSQADWFFNRFFFASVTFRQFIRFRFFVAYEPAQRFTSESLLVLQIALGDEFPFRMFAQRGSAVPQEL